MSSGTVAVWAMKAGDYGPTEFAGTDAGLTAALAYASTGGEVKCGPGNMTISSQQTIPVQARLWLGPGTYTLTGSASFLLSNKSSLIGYGDSATVISLSATSSVTAAIANLNQDATQQSCFLEGFHLDGNQSSGATCPIGILLKLIFVATYVRNVRVTACSGVGMQLEGTTSSSCGSYMLENVVLANNLGDNLYLLEGHRAITFHMLECDNPGTGKYNINISATANSSAQSVGTSFYNTYMEMTDATSSFVNITNAANVSFDNIVCSFPGAGTSPASVIKITGTGNFAGGRSGLTVRNLFAPVQGAVGGGDILIDDQTCSVQVKAGTNSSQPNRFVSWYSQPVASGANGITGQGRMIGVQYQKQGVNLNSAAALFTQPQEGNLFRIDGTADITGIITDSSDAGRIITLRFNGNAATNGVVDGSNLVLAGNFLYTTSDTLTLISDGTNWYEIARSVN